MTLRSLEKEYNAYSTEMGKLALEIKQLHIELIKLLKPQGKKKMFKHPDAIKDIARTLNRTEGMNAPKITKIFSDAKVKASLPSVYAWINNKAEPKAKLGRPKKRK